MDTRTNSPAADATERLQMYIGGQWVAGTSGQTLDSLNPYTQKVWATVPDASEADVKAAVAAAREAFDNGPWRQTTPQQRAALMRKLGDLIARDAERMARIESMDNGKLLREMLGQWKYLPEWMYYFAGQATQSQGEVLPSDRPNFIAFTRKEPIGVVAAITPWNSPCLLLMFKLAPGLAAGCTFVVKPSEHTPVSTLRFAELVEEAGFPPGVFNVVTGGADAGRWLVSSPDIDKISFTGSDGVGKAIARAGAENFTRVSLELGGKSPQVVFDDCDIEAAVNGVISGVYAATGQTCMAGSRLIVHRAIHDEVVKRLVARVSAIKLGDPLDMASEMGPAATGQQFQKILSMVRSAEAEGATLAYGGRQAPQGGFFVQPTVLTQVHNRMDIAREEVFGPVLAVIPFDTEEEAVKIANDTRYGLAAGIWTQNVQRAHRVAGQLRAGSVWINAYRVTAPFAPFGGFKHSGVGRENGHEGMNEFLETKTVWVELSGALRDPFKLG
ncbi:aldehyde dehydrogenase [Hydrogenophaga sp. YM1]|jgi:aldehyde dehydrogenase (NAD+)|uniref:aldehyde dehydrogenase n=1 Tax=Hydrogenophaga TaxID=47420 RepID=UPI00095DC5B8|nr:MULTISPECIES: aldehyde dehydrogenase [unclassified Hydrogenophaga]MBN9370079.1 aldehyde dehydrogenase [Hydrogenophaga sp.]OJV72368.1 MAG: carnitine dehydratase [Hydrogenophaga sp. 70-12]QRR34393.1 aldehyde dehydrogenase [Hydrogenophaga sp. YM1]